MFKVLLAAVICISSTSFAGQELGQVTESTSQSVRHHHRTVTKTKHVHKHRVKSAGSTGATGSGSAGGRGSNG